MTGMLSGVAPVEPAQPGETGPASSKVSSLIHRRAMRSVAALASR